MKNSLIKDLNWRYAVKEFDTKHKIEQSKLDILLEAIRLTPTSFGVQPYKVYVVSSNEVKKHLKAASYNQNQIVECEYLLVFCARKDIQKLTGEYIKLSSQNISLVQKAKLKGFETMVRGYFVGKDEEFTLSWAKNQVYIALGFAIAAAANQKIDSCPMEGFNNDKFDKILGLPESLKSTVILALGKRSKEPTRPKVRFAKEDIFTYID